MPTVFPGYGEARMDGLVRTLIPFELQYDSPAGTYTVPVKAGTFVLSVVTVVKTAFNATSPTLKVGDGSDDDGFLQSGDIAPATAKSATTPAVKLSTGASRPYANGKYYDEDDTIDFIFDPGTGGTTGLLKGHVEVFTHASNLGVAV